MASANACTRPRRKCSRCEILSSARKRDDRLKRRMMPNVLILLTLPKDVRNTYASRLGQKFPELTIDVVDHYSKAPPFMAAADVLLTFGPMMKDEVLHNAPRLKWVQALGTGVDGVLDQPSLGKGVVITNIRGIHGEPVAEAAIMAMLALSRDLPRSI